MRRFPSLSAYVHPSVGPRVWGGEGVIGFFSDGWWNWCSVPLPLAQPQPQPARSQAQPAKSQAKPGKSQAQRVKFQAQPARSQAARSQAQLAKSQAYISSRTYFFQNIQVQFYASKKIAKHASLKHCGIACKMSKNYQDHLKIIYDINTFF